VDAWSRWPRPRVNTTGQGLERYGNSARKFAHVDAYVHERLAIFASIKHGLHGRNQHRFNWVWFTSLGVYRLSGRVRSGTAHALR
jgi:hypothetical protein